MKKIKNEFEFRIDSELISMKAVKPKFQPFGLINGGLSAGIEPTYSEYYIRRTKLKEEIKDYEAYDLMHKHDGTFTKSDRLSSL